MQNATTIAQSASLLGEQRGFYLLFGVHYFFFPAILGNWNLIFISELYKKLV